MSYDRFHPPRHDAGKYGYHKPRPTRSAQEQPTAPREQPQQSRKEDKSDGQ